MKPIKLGVIGARRGLTFAKSAQNGKSQGLELSCLCDFSNAKLEKAAEDFNVAFYKDFDEMLKSDIDAVVLANFFHEHAPLAIKAMKAGKHVMSETIPAGTMAEAVALCEAVEETGMTYMFAENYPFTKMGLAMKYEYEAGTIGKSLFGEGEYMHPFDAEGFFKIAPYPAHWRNYVPSTYYSTHALAPLMFMTGAKPIKVNALSIINSKVSAGTDRKNDPLAIILCTMDDGSVFRVTGWGNAGGHSIWYRIMGEKGTIEAPRSYNGGYFGNGMLTISLNEHETDENIKKTKSYMPDWPKGAEDAQKSGHGGGDYFMNKNFVDAIRSGISPEYFDVYDASLMSAVAILSWRSALEGGIPIEIPDFRDKAARSKFKDDYATPFPNDKGWPMLPTSIQK